MSDESSPGAGDLTDKPDATPPDATSADAASADPAPATPDPTTAAAADPFGGIDQATIDDLLKQASFDDPVAATPATSAAAATAFQDSATAVADFPDTSAIKLPDFQQVMQDAQVSSIDLLRDVDLNVKIELGRS